VSHCFGYIPKSGIAGSYGRSMFRFLRSLQIFFQSGCTSLHSHQQCKRVPFSPHPHQHLLLVVLLMTAILTEVRWNVSVVLICISFITRDGEHFFMCLFSHLNFFTGSLILGEFSFWSSLYILVISPLSDVYLANIFSHSVGGLFSLETISFLEQKFLVL
jgi:hypothetical protein